MLKLQKTSRTSDLALCLREQERFLEPQFIKALMIALVLHVGGLLLFHVSPFRSSSTFVFPPIHVQSDSPLESASTLVTAHLRDEEELSSPPLHLIPPLNDLSFFNESNAISEVALDIHAFESLENRLWPVWHVPLSVVLEEPRIQLAVSGDLAERSLIVKDPLLSSMQPISISSASPAYVTYQVQMDEKTGELFWYERTQSSGVASIDHLTEKILLNLRFSTDRTLESVTGNLHFTIMNVEDQAQENQSLSKMF